MRKGLGTVKTIEGELLWTFSAPHLGYWIAAPPSSTTGRLSAGLQINVPFCYIVLFKSATGREPMMINTQGTTEADYFPFKPCLCLQVWLNSTSSSTSSCITLLYCCLSSEESSSLPSVICAGGFAVAGHTN